MNIHKFFRKRLNFWKEKRMKTEDLLILIIIILLLGSAIHMERMDLYCPQGPDTVDRSLCRDGNGKGLFQTLPRKEDSLSETVQKISRLADAITGRVKWRVSFIGAVLTAFLLNLLLFSEIDWRRLGVTIIIEFLAFYLLLSFYDVHYFEHISRNLHHSAQHITNLTQGSY